MLEEILDIRNIQKSLKQVIANQGAGGIDGMQTDDLKGYLKDHWQELRKTVLDGSYKPQAVRKVAIVMTKQDVLSCGRFSDAIAVASYPLDLHHPESGGCTLQWCGDCYDIPYRSLLPLKVTNLLVAGRCISTTHEAMSAIRVMAPCMAMGEAAGRAAKMDVHEGVSPRDIQVKALQAEILEKGGYLNPAGAGSSVAPLEA